VLPSLGRVPLLRVAPAASSDIVTLVLERFLIRWTYLIEKDSLKFKKAPAIRTIFQIKKANFGSSRSAIWFGLFFQLSLERGQFRERRIGIGSAFAGSFFAAAELTSPPASAILRSAPRLGAVVAPIALLALEALSRLTAPWLAPVRVAVLPRFVRGVGPRGDGSFARGPAFVVASFGAPPIM
jgi:hypothetical protein